MRKLMILCISAFLLCSCKTDTKKQDTTVANTTYEGYYKAIEDNSRFQSDSIYFSIDGDMVRMQDGTYRFYITIDEPQVAMYDVSTLAVVDRILFDNATVMMPSLGIFETNAYHMIPYQANAKKGYVKGIVISGESNSEPIHIQMLVEWYDRTHENQHREFLEFDLDINGIVPEEEEVIEEVVEEEVVEEESEDDGN